jgi:D-sedoheptulose 7-phosphate isomerase
MDKNFLKEYFEDFTQCLNQDDNNLIKLIDLKNRIIETSQNKGKIIIIGNGGSAAISSHFSVDLTKNARVTAINFNEADLITCFSNDYGYENWVSKALEFYSDPQDLIILISSSGKSENMINAAETAINLGIKNLITFTGFSKDNPLRKKGHLNFWVDSKAYNFVENIHQIWLLSIVDLIIGDKLYEA